MKYKRNKIIGLQAVLLLLVLLFPFGLNSQEIGNKGKKDPITLKVAAYNVEYSDKGTAEEIGKALKPFDFDIVCFVEAPDGDWIKRVGKVMGLKHSMVGQYSTAGHKDKYKTILSRTPLKDQREVLMSDTLHTAARALTKIKGRKVAIYSVHFPFGWRDQAHIDETTHKISTFVDYLDQAPDDEIALVIGDLNFILSTEEQESPYYEMFRKLGMDTSWGDLGIDVTGLSTMAKPGGENRPGGRVIDHIIYPTDKVRALDGQIIEMDRPLSDHKPVWALLELK